MQSAFNTFAASAGETCDGKDCEIIYPEVAKKYIYWMAGMQFLNAILPGVYFAAISRYSWRKDYDDDFALFDKKQENKIPRKGKLVGDGDDDDDDDDKDGKYGYFKRYWVWSILTYTHASVWGTGAILFILSFFGNLANWYRFYIEHILSNLNYLTYLTGIILLALAAGSSGLQGWLELTIYAFLFAGAIYFVELVMGVRSMQALDRTYKYDDKLLLPSLFYLFMEHVLREDPNEKVEEENTDPFGFENDPSSNADVPIDEFLFSF